MKRLLLPALLFTSILLSSCEIVGTIFKGGMWTGIILVIIVLLIVVFIFSRTKK